LYEGGGCHGGGGQYIGSQNGGLFCYAVVTTEPCGTLPDGSVMYCTVVRWVCEYSSGSGGSGGSGVDYAS
jgi:hypothetical protein